MTATRIERFYQTNPGIWIDSDAPELANGDPE